MILIAASIVLFDNSLLVILFVIVVIVIMIMILMMITIMIAVIFFIGIITVTKITLTCQGKLEVKVSSPK